VKAISNALYQTLYQCPTCITTSNPVWTSFSVVLKVMCSDCTYKLVGHNNYVLSIY